MKFFIRFGSYTFGSCVLGVAICQTTAIKISCSADPNIWNNNWDEMNALNGRGVRNILLIRHGQYNTQGVTDSERSLTSLGQQQAASLGICIANMRTFLEIPITAVHCSSMTRAKQTYETARQNYATENNSSVTDFPIALITPDIAEGPPHAHDPPHSNWKPTPQDIQICQQRLDKAFKRHFHRPTANENTLEIFFCHANVTRYFLCKALQLPLNAWLRFNLRHCSITWLIIGGNGKVSCQSYGDTGFMPSYMLTDR